MSRPRIVLHIGRNKVGSTTIQEACFASRGRLAEKGFGYGLIGHLWQSRDELPGWMTFDALADHADSSSDICWIVSNEFMSAWPIEFTREAHRALNRFDVTVLAYVRRYDHWVRSAYAEDTKAGVNRRDIDAYLDHMRPMLSVLPNLEGWAKCFGWEHMRVRSLDPVDLAGGDLIADFSHAIGLDRPLDPVRNSNVAPHWIELELIRAVANLHVEGEREGRNSDVVGPLVTLLRSAMTSEPDIPYLTTDQSSGLLAIYNADIDVLRRHGQSVTPVAALPLPRTFLPALAQAPKGLVRAFFDAAAEPDFVSRYPLSSRTAADLASDYLQARC
jgi:hypothetical protein